MARFFQHVVVVCAAALLAACSAGAGGKSGGSGPPPGAGGNPPPPPTNHFPIVRTADTFVFPKAIAGHPLDYDVAQNFSDEDGDPLTFTVTLNGVDATGEWRGLRVSGSHIVGTPTLPPFSTVEQTGFWMVASDGRGGSVETGTVITIQPNATPVVTRAGEDRILGLGASVDLETLQATTFEDADGDPLTITVSLLPLARGLHVEGTSVRGVIDSNGAVFVHVKADDGFGGTAEDVFALAAPADETRRPTLPATSFIYDDAQLTMPQIARFARQFFAPLWDTTEDSQNITSNAGATLGRVLFYDKRLSITNMGSCGSCHLQQHGFASPEAFTAGPQGELTKRNVMGLTGVRYNLDNLYFGDRRAFGLENLVLLPIQEPTELGNSLELLIPKLAATDFYPPLFEAAFGTPEITPERIAQALAQFLRSMIAFNTRFDHAYQPVNEGEEAHPELVLTAQELQGADIFNQHCSRCHSQGAQTMDVSANNGLDLVPADPGSGEGRFRAASLRNVAVTAPYMHDGRFATLRDVIEHYSSGVVDGPLTDPRMRSNVLSNSVNRNFTEDEKAALEAFLDTFTDEEFLTNPKFSDPFQ
ncbi:MAG TPA: cytochrome c peroxidase [Steroidobacteraceae bacterium]|jgi:cytochrome c peroxidase